MIRKRELGDIVEFIEATGRIENMYVKDFGRHNSITMTFTIENTNNEEKEPEQTAPTIDKVAEEWLSRVKKPKSHCYEVGNIEIE